MSSWFRKVLLYITFLAFSQSRYLPSKIITASMVIFTNRGGFLYTFSSAMAFLSRLRMARLASSKFGMMNASELSDCVVMLASNEMSSWLRD